MHSAKASLKLQVASRNARKFNQRIHLEKMAYSLGIDSSTQSMSAIVIDLDNKCVVCEHSINFGERLPHYNSPNGFYIGESANEVFSNPLMCGSRQLIYF